MEVSSSHLLEIFIVTTLLFLHSHTYLSAHAYCYCFGCMIYLLMCICVHIALRLCCVCVFQLSHIRTDVIVGLLINSSKCVFVSVDFALFFSCERY